MDPLPPNLPYLLGQFAVAMVCCALWFAFSRRTLRRALARCSLPSLLRSLPGVLLGPLLLIPLGHQLNTLTPLPPYLMFYAFLLVQIERWSASAVTSGFSSSPTTQRLVDCLLTCAAIGWSLSLLFTLFWIANCLLTACPHP
ncbi:MAG: hypothetical protein GDA55_02315 [Cellvibrionales bacterium]|nr:hypothetical protein [Cellvibrionales bacterium]